MTTITITDIADLRAGDVATCSYEGHKFTGELWENAYGELFVGAAFVRYADGSPSPTISLVSATREVPDLPTEPGSVIANVVTRDGGHYDWAMLVDPGEAAFWAATDDQSYAWLRSGRIVSWTPCTVEVQA